MSARPGNLFRWEPRHVNFATEASSQMRWAASACAQTAGQGRLGQKLVEKLRLDMAKICEMDPYVVHSVPVDQVAASLD